MHTQYRQNIQDFWVVGINYKKSDASVRSLFAVNNEQYAQLLSQAAQHGVNNVFIVSTCNRTEIYGFAADAFQLASLLCSGCAGDPHTFMQLAYAKSGEQAVSHLFQVGGGLDSQILGDYEILGQIKNAVKFAKANGEIGPFMERLVNAVLQSSKAIKTHTSLSSGTVSVSFAAVQYIRQHTKSVKNKKILLVGTGKIGRTTCRNIVDYLGTKHITLVNRTEEHAITLAAELGLDSVPFTELDSAIRQADIILVSTNAPEPVILEHHLRDAGGKLVIDLSVPYNVADGVKALPGISVVDVDMLSKIKDETLQARSAEVPKAMEIIDSHIAEFKEWCAMRRHVPVLKEVKSKLKKIYISPSLLNGEQASVLMPPAVQEEKINKVITSLAMKIRRQNTVGCHYIEAINDFIAL